MHFLIWETLSFNLMYVAACYPVGTTISKTSSLFTALLQHYRLSYCAVTKISRVYDLIVFSQYLKDCLTKLYSNVNHHYSITRLQNARPVAVDFLLI